jgi:DNA-binding MarR family transcriptional regulator
MEVKVNQSGDPAGEGGGAGHDTAGRGTGGGGTGGGGIAGGGIAGGGTGGGGTGGGGTAGDTARGADRRRLNRAIKLALRDLGTELSRLNHSVGGRLDLKGTDLACLDLVTQEGPVSPSALARRAGLHPATVTGILDRLERGGWVVRERDPADRRGVVVRAERGRGAEILRLYLVDSGMNAAMDDICAQYEPSELDLVAGFLRRTAAAGAAAAAQLAGQPG